MRVTRYAIFVLVALACLPAARAANPARDELLKLVPPDTAVCLVVQGLRDRAKAIGESPFSTWVAEKFAPLVNASGDIQKIRDTEKILTAILGITTADLRDELLGDAIVLAYQPGPPGKPEAESGSILLKARNPETLRKLLDKFNAAQKDGGELTEVVERTHRERTYQRRVKSNGKSEYYILEDGLFVFAAQESAITAVIDQQLAPVDSVPRVAKAIADLGVADAFLVCWVNPRRLDAEILAHAKAAEEPKDRAAREQVRKLWSAVDQFAIYVDVRSDLEIGIAATYRAEAMLPEWKNAFEAAPARSALWQSIPDDAMLAITGHATANQIITLMLSFSPEVDKLSARKEIEKSLGAIIGKDKLPAVLSGVGPDTAIWAAKPNKGFFPAITLAVQVDATDPTVPVAVKKAVDFYAQFAQFEYNRKNDDAIEQIDDKTGGWDVKSFANPKRFPPGVEPAYSMKDGYLLFGSSPAVVRSFVAPTKREVNTADVPLVRVSATAIREYLRTHQTPVVQWLSEVQSRPVEELQKEFHSLADILEAFDRIELVASGNGQKIRLGLRVKFVQPLEKGTK